MSIQKANIGDLFTQKKYNEIINIIENKIKKKDLILVFVEAKKKQIVKNLKKRKNYNLKIIKILKKYQLTLKYKKKKSNFVIKNNFKVQSIKKNVKFLIKRILAK